MLTFPIPTTPPILHDNGAVYEAVYDFIALFAVPSVAPQNIIRAWQNRAHPPANSKEQIIITALSHERRGSNVEIYGVDTMMSKELVVCRVQIDCYSEKPETARARAQSVAHAARSSVGIRFFAQRGIGCQRAADCRDFSFVDETQQFLPRWTTELFLSFTNIIEYEQPTFDAVNVTIEDVDVHHSPPTQNGGSFHHKEHLSKESE